MKKPKHIEVIVLSDRDRDLFLETLVNPPPPNKKLVEAMKKYKKKYKTKE